MDQAIRKGFDKVRKTASKEEKSLIRLDRKLDKKCEARKKIGKKK